MIFPRKNMILGGKSPWSTRNLAVSVALKALSQDQSHELPDVLRGAGSIRKDLIVKDVKARVHIYI